MRDYLFNSRPWLRLIGCTALEQQQREENDGIGGEGGK